MAINYSTAVANARLDQVSAALEAGSGPGVLQIGSAAMASVLVEIPLDDPIAAASSRVLALLAAPETAEAIASGTAAAARLVDSDDNVIASGLTVGTSGTDVVLDSTAITSGQNVTVNSAAITHP
jgi:hypothetical protein